MAYLRISMAAPGRRPLAALPASLHKRARQMPADEAQQIGALPDACDDPTHRAGAGVNRRSLLAFSAGLAVPISPLVAEPLIRTFDFEDMQAGQRPPGFSFALTGGGKDVDWRVLNEPTAPAGSKVLTELSRDTTDYRFPLAIVDDISGTDVRLAVDFCPVEGAVDRAAGLVWRLQDPLNYYVARANALEDNVRLYRVLQGRRIQFASATAGVAQGRWQRLSIEAAGTTMTVALNGAQLIKASDSTFAGAGRVGLWTKADSITYFNNFSIRLR
jgi:hypothetical protein